MSKRLPEAFSKNRSEESSSDNWADFIIPPFLNDIGIENQTKALVITGGRGCGKTALVRYCCQATQFSPKRRDLIQENLKYIGLYWRADTNFLNSFVGGSQSSETWQSAFQHLLACEIGLEIIKALHNINLGQKRQDLFGGLAELNLEDLGSFGVFDEFDLAGVRKTLERASDNLAAWINNIETYSKPAFLPAKQFLKRFIDILQEKLPYLKDSTFSVFIDEYENLREDQQKFINGLLKHGEHPLLYNIAMKRNGFHSHKTLGNEHIQEIADYRTIDLESNMEGHFELFAAELILFRLALYFPEMNESIPVSADRLRDRAEVEARYQDAAYKKEVFAAVRKMLPRVNERDAAKRIVSDNRLRSVLLDNIASSLGDRKRLDLSPNSFLHNDFPEASVIMPVLLARPREDPDRVLKEFMQLTAGASNRLSQGRDLIDNNLYGCANKIYIDAKRTSVLFSGYEALLLIAKGNVRHLLELVHRVFRAEADAPTDSLPIVTAEKQADEMRAASESILASVKGFGSKGPQLYALSVCLGSIFRERHRSSRQSEPETNHFVVSAGNLTPALQTCLSEAEKWSILFTTSQTKLKSVGVVGQDYVLNPVFSPCFQISYRKKRSIGLSTQQIMQMFEADQKERDQLVRVLSANTEEPSSGQSSLFEKEI